MDRQTIERRRWKIERISSQNKKYKTVSLFSGIGGFDLGFEYAGFDITWANDFDKFAVETYKANVGEPIVCGDINDVKDQIPHHDVLIAGFPCQPFSKLGAGKGFDDKGRGDMFFVIRDIIDKYKTKVVVLENVKNIMSHDGGKTFERIITELSSIGYECFYQTLDSKDYGVPQSRKRLFLVGVRKDCFKQDGDTGLMHQFEFPGKIDLSVKLKDILDDDVKEKYFVTKRFINTILTHCGKPINLKTYIDRDVAVTLCATVHKMHDATQDPYVTDDKNFAKIKGDDRTHFRRLTPNECRKLQGFPSDWTQVVSDHQAYRQFGNAVTVNVSYAIATNLMSYMDKYLNNEGGD